MLKRLHADERGVAMIVAMLVGMVVLSLSLVTVQLSIHNSDASSYDRKRVQAVHAAEAGLDAYIALLPRTPIPSLQCTAPAAAVPIDPGAEFRVSAAFYPTYPGVAGQELPCPLSPANPPAGAVITSTGTAVGATTARPVSRTMQAEVRLNPILGLFTHAIFSDTGFDIGNNLTVTGNAGNDGNLYTNGSFACTNSTLDYGSVVAHGTVTMAGSCRILQDLWTSGNVTMQDSARVGHDLTTSAGSVTIANPASVGNNVRTAGSCSGCAGRVGGTITTNSPSPDPTTVGFPTVNYVESEWVAAGYTIRNEPSCANALTFIRNLNGSTTPHVVRIPTNCSLNFGGSDTVRLGADLAIISNGPMSMTQSTRFLSTSTTSHDAFFIVPRSLFSPSTPPDSRATSCSGQNITIANNTDFTRVRTFFYTPCTMTIANNTLGMAGQIIGGTVDLQNQFSMAFRPMLIPGFGSVIGYNPDIAYIREITTP